MVRCLKNYNELTVKLFLDGADLQTMQNFSSKDFIKGFTTNPTLVRQAGVKNYKDFAKQVLQLIPDRPISFEVFADDFPTMEKEAREISSWGPNVYVKIPVVNTKGEFSSELIRRLSHDGIKINVTAVFLLRDVVRVCETLQGGAPSNVSVFAGRIADAGQDPMPIIRAAAEVCNTVPGCELIWASSRELYNVVQAHEAGCHIITVTPALLGKLTSIGTDLWDFTLDTVKMFYRDAKAAGYRIL